MVIKSCIQIFRRFSFVSIFNLMNINFKSLYEIEDKEVQIFLFNDQKAIVFYGRIFQESEKLSSHRIFKVIVDIKLKSF